MDEHNQNQPEDPEEAEATVLPAREAMSIIAPDTSPYVPDLEPVSETTPDGTGTAHGEESATSDDRSDHITSRNTATPET